jgi:hypothetical protein
VATSRTSTSPSHLPATTSPRGPPLARPPTFREYTVRPAVLLGWAPLEADDSSASNWSRVHNCADLPEPTASIEPHTDTANRVTPATNSTGRPTCSPVYGSHTRTVLSQLPVRSKGRRPGLAQNTTRATSCPCPVGNTRPAGGATLGPARARSRQPAAKTHTCRVEGIPSSVKAAMSRRPPATSAQAAYICMAPTHASSSSKALDRGSHTCTAVFPSTPPPLLPGTASAAVTSTMLPCSPAGSQHISIHGKGHPDKYSSGQWACSSAGLSTSKKRPLSKPLFTLQTFTTPHQRSWLSARTAPHGLRATHLPRRTSVWGWPPRTVTTVIS